MFNFSTKGKTMDMLVKQIHIVLIHWTGFNHATCQCCTVDQLMNLYANSSVCLTGCLSQWLRQKLTIFGTHRSQYIFQTTAFWFHFAPPELNSLAAATRLTLSRSCSCGRTHTQHERLWIHSVLVSVPILSANIFCIYLRGFPNQFSYFSNRVKSIPIQTHGKMKCICFI